MIRRAVLSFGILFLAGAAFADAALDDVTVANTGRAAFQQHMPFLTQAEVERFRAGAAIFRQPWLVAPSGEDTRFDGLGPLSNRLSCVGCHIGNGRGEPPAGENDAMRSMLVRLSVSGKTAQGAPMPEPHYGDQLQTDGIAGVPAEGKASIRWHDETRVLADGTSVSMRRPEILLGDLHYGPFAPGTMMSARMAPAAFGLGLLQAVPDAELIALADAPNKQNGVRGRLNHVWDAASGRMAIGRFGLKANQPTLKQQVAAALIGDMGISSALYPDQNCTPVETACAQSPHGGDPEISGADFDALVFTIEASAPPARRSTGEGTAAQGEALFQKIGCAACHVPSLTTGDDPDFPQAAHKTIHPYTDLLLHDMGDDLSDGRPDFAASGRDWRTAPLWGVGLAGKAGAHPTYLHDGRARDLAEAILWHGGEALPARDAFASLSAGDRQAILAFLATL